VKKLVLTLKVDLLGKIIGFAASKKPRNPKLTLNLYDQFLSCESLVQCIPHSPKSQTTKAAVNRDRQKRKLCQLYTVSVCPFLQL